MIYQTKTVELYESLKPGDRLKYFYQPGNVNNRIVHVRGRVDNILIVRRWSRGKVRWIYDTMGYWDFEVPHSYGSLKIIKSRKVFNEEDQSGAPFTPKVITVPIPDTTANDDIERNLTHLGSASIEVEYI